MIGFRDVRMLWVERMRETGNGAFGLLLAVLVTPAIVCLPAAAQRAPVGADLGRVELSFAGPEEVVVPTDEMSCEKPTRGRRSLDVPDMPPAAFRRADGTVIMLAGNRQNFYLQGPDLDHVTRSSCHSLLPYAPKDDPAAYQDNEWLFALYSFDGSTVLGFVHNEYHGEEHGNPSCTFSNRENRTCWYASTTLVKSTDGGMDFERPASGDNVVASLPYKFTTAVRRAQVGAPKVVGDPKSGDLYIMTSFADRNRGISIGQCLIRAPNANKSTWRVWDGKSFDTPIANPYRASEGESQAADCSQVVKENLMSVKYARALDAYIGVAMRRDRIVYTLSKDLINWTPVKTLANVSTFASWKPGAAAPVWYVSMLDPTSKSRNFDTLETRPYLYYVRFRVDGNRLVNARRDVMRRALSITGN